MHVGISGVRFAIAILAIAALPFTSLGAAENRPPFYGVYVLQNGRFTELPEAIIVKSASERTPDLTVPRPEDSGYLGYVIHDKAGASFKSGKISFVIYDRNLGMLNIRSAIVSIVARIRGGMEKDGSENVLTPNLDVTRFEGLRYLAAYPPPYWIVRSKGYEVRAAPFGESNQMMLLRSSEAAFTFPPGRYRLAFLNRNYDFVVEGASGPQHCVDLIQWKGYHLAKYQTFEECRTSGYRPGVAHEFTHSGHPEPTTPYAPPERPPVKPVTQDISSSTGVVRARAPIPNLGPWQPYSFAPNDAGFTFESPVQPIQARTAAVVAGHSSEYRYEMPLGIDSALVRSYEYTPAEGQTTNQILGQLARESAKELKGTIIGNMARTIDGHPGLDALIEGDVQHAWIRIYLVGHHVYELRTMSPTGEPMWPDMQRFFSSFALTGGATAR